MNRDDFAAICIELDRLTLTWDGVRCEASVIVGRAKRIVRHAKRLRSLTDEKAIQRILRKVEVLTGTPWEAETSGGITYLVGPFFIPHD